MRALIVGLVCSITLALTINLSQGENDFPSTCGYKYQYGAYIAVPSDDRNILEIMTSLSETEMHEVVPEKDWGRVVWLIYPYDKTNKLPASIAWIYATDSKISLDPSYRLKLTPICTTI